MKFQITNSCEQWLRALADTAGGLRCELGAVFGGDETLIRQRACFYETVLASAAPILGAQPCFLVRCPARVNLMGMHVEHQGGLENPICIPREHLAVIAPIAPCEDDRIVLDNVDGRYAQAHLKLSDLATTSLLQGDWQAWCRGEAPVQAGAWSNYVLGAAAQMLRHVRGRSLSGFHMVLGSDIPLASGLSSSAALVLVTLKALQVVNNLDVSDAEMIRMAGAAELVVGTLGGDGDGSTMVNARAGQCVHHWFFPYEAATYALPPELGLLLVNSGQRAAKQDNAKDAFNERITCYHLGRLLLRGTLRERGVELEHLGQVAYGDFGLTRRAMYLLLKSLPLRMTRTEARERLEVTDRDELDFIFSTHAEPRGGYRIRRRVLFGIAEMNRADVFRDAALRGDAAELGRLKTIGHNGDRVVWIAPGYETPDDDAYLDNLALNDMPPAYVNGGYECSTPALDAIVDAALECNAVFGAGLTGAGLGGSVVVLCGRESRDAVEQHLRRRLPDVESIEPIHPVRGLSVLATEQGAS